MLVYYRDNFGYADAHMDRHLIPRQIAPATPGPLDWREALDIVAIRSCYCLLARILLSVSNLCL
jgi:hypothetical protein